MFINISEKWRCGNTSFLIPHPICITHPGTSAGQWSTSKAFGTSITVALWSWKKTRRWGVATYLEKKKGLGAIVTTYLTTRISIPVLFFPGALWAEDAAHQRSSRWMRKGTWVYTMLKNFTQFQRRQDQCRSRIQPLLEPTVMSSDRDNSWPILVKS